MDLIDTLSVTASGLTAQRVRMQTVAANLANARTTRTEAGGPYRRRMPVFESRPQDPFADQLGAARRSSANCATARQSCFRSRRAR